MEEILSWIGHVISLVPCKDSSGKKTGSILRTILNATFETKPCFNSMKWQILFCKRLYEFEDLK